MAEVKPLEFEFRVGPHRVRFRIPPVRPGAEVVIRARWEDPVTGRWLGMPLLTSDQARQYVENREGIIRRVMDVLGLKSAHWKVLHEVRGKPSVTHSGKVH